MKILKLSNRLQAIADMVIPGTGGIIDIGTDHGYIPIYFAQNNYPGEIYASDIKEGPLSRAIAFAEEYNVKNKISFHLSDGLMFSDGKAISTVIIAGMGGENIIDILKLPDWLNENVQIVLQPQSKINALIAWLNDNGFVIDNARLVKDSERIYLAFSAFKGKLRNSFSNNIMSANEILLENRDPLFKEYLMSLIDKTKKELIGIQKGKTLNKDELIYLKGELAGFNKMLEEVLKW